MRREQAFETLYEASIKKGLTVKDLAYMTGYSKSRLYAAVKKYRTGEHSVPLELLAMLAETCQVDLVIRGSQIMLQMRITTSQVTGLVPTSPATNN